MTTLSVFPRFIALKVLGKFLRCNVDVESETPGLLQFSGDDAFSPDVKFELEMAESYDGAVHIKCSSNDKYLVCSKSDKYKRTIVTAAADKPEENRSSKWCTTFEFRLVSSVEPCLQECEIRHLSSPSFADRWFTDDEEYYLFSGLSEVLYDDVIDFYPTFAVIDLESILMLPKYVAFKGDNGQYLSCRNIHGRRCLQFSGRERNDPSVVNEIVPVGDGSIRIKSICFNDYWTRDTEINRMDSDFHHPKPIWIWVDSSACTYNPEYAQLFWPVQISDTKIALRCLGSNYYSSRMSHGNMENCLCSAVLDTIAASTELEVEEVVFSRNIYDVKYRLKYAKRSNERVVVLGTSNAVNHTDEPSHLDVKLLIKEIKTSTWKRVSSMKLGVKASIQVDEIPLVTDGNLQASMEVQGTYDYGETVTREYTNEAVYKVKVPPRQKVIVNAKATEATIHVPFSYLQRDRIYNGKDEISKNKDGVYVGVNHYSFSYEHIYEKLPL